MISKIKIKNFQSHEDTEFDFVEGINAIVGTSGNGKSSVLRALNWVIFNKPGGISFRKHNTDEVKVEAVIDGISIKRWKSNTENSYFLNEKELTAFGQSTPEEISDLIHFDELNLQSQMDNPFLIAESPGEAAKILNKVINLEKIDSSLSYIESLKRKTNKEIENEKIEIEKHEFDLKNYLWVDKAKTLLNELREKEKEYEKIAEKADGISYLVDIINPIRIKMREIKKKLLVEDELNKLVKSNNEYADLSDKIEKLTNSIKSIKSISKRLDDGFPDIEPELKKIIYLEKENDKLRQNKKNTKELESLVFNLKSFSVNLTEKDFHLEKLKKKLKDIMPETCPICGNKMEGKKDE